MSNDDYQHQDFWTKVNEKLNQELELMVPEKTWMQEQEKKFLKQLQEDLKTINQIITNK